MRKVVVTCDSCGTKIEEGYFRECTVNFHLNEWAGGSLGGIEDEYEIEADLCAKCAHKLKKFLENELKLKNKNIL